MRPLSLPPELAPLLALGAATGVGQAVLLREGMAALGGSEVAWGAVLAVWLAGMGAGSWLGGRRARPGSARVLPAGSLALVGAGVVLLRAAPLLTGAAAGEAGSAWGTAWVWLLAVLPAALTAGWAFPALVAGAAETAPGRAYALESAGAVAGGAAFTFLLAGLGSAGAVLCGIALTLGAVARRGWRVAATVALLGGAVAAAGPAGDALTRAGWAWSRRPGEPGRWRETAQQRLEASGTTPVALYADGRLAATWPDPWRVAPRAHLAMLLHPDPRRVLLVGAPADGSVATLLAHRPDSIEVVDEDRAATEFLRDALGAEFARSLDDPRVLLRHGDPIRLVRGAHRYDLVLLLDPDPATLRQARTRSAEFFAATAASLAPGGVLVVRVGVGDTYLGGVGGRLLATVHASVRTAFPAVAAVPGDEVLLVAARDRAAVVLDPVELARRWASRGIVDPAFPPELLGALLDTGRATTLAGVLAAADEPPSTAARPRAVPLAAALVEVRGSPSLVRAVAALGSVAPWALGGALVLAVAGLLAGALARRPAGVEIAAVVGFCSMGWWLLLLAAWQATVGAVYSEVGALSACFMAGIAGGAAAARRRRPGPRSLAVVMLGGVGLSLGIAAGLPAGAVPPLLLLAGGLTGAAFPAVAAMAGGAAARRAGVAFAADEVGAAVSAAVVGVLALPALGARPTAIGLGFLAAAAAATLALARERRR